MRALLLLLSLVFSNMLLADDTSVSATPYRPTISNPAELPVPGWLELEGGWAQDHGGGVKRHALIYTAKLAFNQDWGVFLSREQWIHEHGAGTDAGTGDTNLFLKHRISTSDEDQNFGIEAGVKLPTASGNLGSGKPDWTVNGIYSLDFAEDWRLDANLGATRVGENTPDTGRTSWLWAAALSRSIGDWTLAGELSGTHQDGFTDTHQILGAVSYAIHPRLVLDAGMSLTEEGSQHSHSLFFGFTWLTGKLF